MEIESNKAHRVAQRQELLSAVPTPHSRAGLLRLSFEFSGLQLSYMFVGKRLSACRLVKLEKFVSSTEVER